MSSTISPEEAADKIVGLELKYLDACSRRAEHYASDEYKAMQDDKMQLLEMMVEENCDVLIDDDDNVYRVVRRTESKKKKRTPDEAIVDFGIAMQEPIDMTLVDQITNSVKTAVKAAGVEKRREARKRQKEAKDHLTTIVLQRGRSPLRSPAHDGSESGAGSGGGGGDEGRKRRGRKHASRSRSRADGDGIEKKKKRKQRTKSKK